MPVTVAERPIFRKFPARAEYIETGENRTLPNIFTLGSGMRRFVMAPDLSYRAGYTKVTPGGGFRTFFWYDEFWVILEGGGNVTAVDRPTGQTVKETLEVHDLVYIPAGTHITVDVSKGGAGHMLFFYIAIPASNKHAVWLASMTPEDIEDIRIRQEHTREGFDKEGARGFVGGPR